MSEHDHHHHHAPHAEAAAPTLSLLRLSAAQRLAATALVVCALWALVAWVTGLGTPA